MKKLLLMSVLLLTACSGNDLVDNNLTTETVQADNGVDVKIAPTVALVSKPKAKKVVDPCAPEPGFVESGCEKEVPLTIEEIRDSPQWLEKYQQCESWDDENGTKVESGECGREADKYARKQLS